MRSSAFFVLACLAVLLGPTAAQVSQWAKPKWCKERDCPRFELINDAKGYQTRKYEPAIWAWFHVTDAEDPEEGMYRAYSHLLRYFQGENERQEMIPMSVPIAHNITIKREKKMGITFDRRRPPKMDITIKFYLPFTYQDGPGTPPHPNADEVHVDRFPEWTAHVREFEGFPTHRAFKRHYKDLVERLDDEGEDFATSWALFSVYNEPKEPEEERHNEVLLPAWSEKKKQSAKVKLVKSWKTWKAWTS